MSYELIIFDCDGTLVDSEYLNNRATCELLAEQGLARYDMDYAFAHFVGRKFSEILKGITVETGHVFPMNMAQRYVTRAHELIPEFLKPVEGAAALLETARAHFKIALASNGQRDNVIACLKQAGLLDYFGGCPLLAGTDVENAKPAPDIFLRAAAEAGIEPGRTLVIEDSVPGATGGRAAGMDVWGFSGAHQDPAGAAQKLKNAGAVKVYGSLIHIAADLSV